MRAAICGLIAECEKPAQLRSEILTWLSRAILGEEGIGGVFDHKIAWRARTVEDVRQMGQLLLLAMKRGLITRSVTDMTLGRLLPD